MKTVVEEIFARASEFPEKIAITNGKHALTYRELAESVVQARNLLCDSYGIAAGDAVVLAADKQPAFVSLYFACHLLGAHVLPLAPDTNPVHLGFICKACAPKLFIGIHTPAFYQGREVSLQAFERLATDAVLTENLAFPDMDDVADILFTTGTTGLPKGVLLTHRNLAAAARNIHAFVRNDVDDVEMLALPVSHSFGLKRMTCALVNGQALVLLGSFANMKRFYRFMETYHVNGFGMVPAAWAMIRRMSGQKLGAYASQLHYIEIGSAPMPMADKQELIKLLPDTRICMHYGLTEASRSTFLEFHKDIEHLETIGRATPNVTVEIRDDSGKRVADGIPGELCVFGDVVAMRYLASDEENKHSHWGEFFRTGDIGIREDGGWIQLIGRAKEIINVGGKKVSPVEIEQELMRLPEIRDCACLAVQDPQGILGEVVKAFVVLEDNASMKPKEWTQRLAGRLENYKIPAMYESIDAIPKTYSGKVQRLALR